MSPRTQGAGAGLARLSGSRVYPRAHGRTRERHERWGESAVYPRAHGGNRASISAMSAWNGLSPHAGGPTDRALDPVRMGSIPAARGKRQTGLLRIFDERSILTHGGNSLRCSRSALVSGLSPRTRGEHRALPRGESRRGSIPAHTGGRGHSTVRLRPRSSIPACAGEHGNRPGDHRDPRSIPAHARVGENYATSADVGRRSGISPRTQGKRQHDVAMEIPVRSIPAHAGEKSGHRPEPTRRESIPAHAGGTGREIESVRVAGVYPRANGGNATTEIRRVLRSGLSPRARGEPGASRGSAAPSGSIAAYAGRDR